MNTRKLVKEYLNPIEDGFIIPDENEQTYQISQKEIVDSVDITSAQKYFNLKLDYGPYSLDYFINGRNLLIGGKKGHVAALDWISKDLTCEFNVRESIHDVCWLQLNDRFSIAQKDWVYVYDNKGTQLHILKNLYRVKKLTYLPYHYLMVSVSETNYLSWLDVSVGKIIKIFRPSKLKKITNLCQNPYNAIVCTSHTNGVVSMWTPNMDEAVVKILCHGSPINDLCVDNLGRYLITASVDKKFKIFDLRNYKNLQTYKLNSIPQSVEISQKNILAIASGQVINIYKNFIEETITKPYLKHKVSDFVKKLKFCNYEDVLGIGHEKGFSSILVPGSGEPNFDAYEANPFLTNKQRRELEVKKLLDKIPAELICLEPDSLGKLDSDIKPATNSWKFNNVDLMKSFDKEIKNKTGIRLGKKKKLKILEIIKNEKKNNIRKFQKRKIKKKKSRFSSKNNIE